jgi:predicted acyltransferase
MDKPRITSLDQFRGYTVVGMCLVNFLAPFAAVPALLKHNESWFSYADSIMPSFFFVVGFSFRLTYLRRRASTTRLQTAKAYLRRSLVLFVLSFAIYALTTDWSRWTDSGPMPAEFDPGRALPLPTKSMEPIVARARLSAPDQNLQAVLQRAEQISAQLDKAEPEDPAARVEYRAAQQAAGVAHVEEDLYLKPAIERVKAWQALGHTGRLVVRWRIQAGRLLKADLWETLAMIAAAQLLVLPWIGCGPLMRLAILVAYGLSHLALCAWFNWDFVYGINNNWMSRWWMTGDCRSWDGGVFGSLSWAVAILAGTLAYDLTAGAPSRAASARRLFALGGAFAILGYSLSCLTRLYDLNGLELSEVREAHWRQKAEQAWCDTLIEHNERLLKIKEPTAADRVELEARIAVLRDQRAAYPDLDLAPNPFLPAWSQACNRSLSGLLAEPPFVAPPHDDPQSAAGPAIEHRLWNYWMLGKRVPTLSFMLLATGFASILYSLFIIACDSCGLRLGVFRTFGTNALVAYFVHGMLTLALWPLVPKSVGIAGALTAFAVFLTGTYLLVRQLEKRGIYIKL